jgi:glycosyltransferase involved in cell wall biosynthesis
MSEPKLSVISINKNNLLGLARTVESFLAQTHPHKELIIIDCVSNDGSIDYLQTLSEVESITFISEIDNGIYDAMNKGVALATGEIIWFMNSGDSFSTIDILEFIAKSYKNERWSWGFGLARSLNDESEKRIYALVPFSLTRVLLGVSTIPHQAAVFDKDFFLKIGGYADISALSSDQQMMAKAAIHCSPKVWLEFFADFQGGGQGSRRKPWSYPLEMLKFRRRNHIYVSQIFFFDYFLTAMLLLWRFFLVEQKKIRMSLGKFTRWVNK